MRLKTLVTGALCVMASQILNAHQFSRALLSTSNEDTDNLTAMVMDANFTYVVQNLYNNPASTPPYTTFSLSGALGVHAPATGNKHASMIVDRIDNATGAIVNLARVDITVEGSDVEGTAITLWDGKLYVTGSFAGTVKPSGVVSAKTASGYDMFLCSISTTATGVLAWNQSSGDGDEYATCISNSLGTLFVGGYYTVYDGSLGLTSTWPTSPVTTADLITTNDQRNTFITRFSSSTLACTQATGWMTLTNEYSSAEIHGIATIVAADATVSYVTGRVTGSTTNPTFSTSTDGYTFFTARFVNKVLTVFPTPPVLPHYEWALTEGNYQNASGVQDNPINSGRAIVFGSSTELYVVGAASYYLITSPPGYHSGNSDAVLIKFTGITGVTPTKAYVVTIGGTDNDVANAVVNDGLGYLYVAGRMGQSNYSLTTISPATTHSYTSSAPSNVFVARYNTSGTMQWPQVAGGHSVKSTASALAYNARCNVAVGGSFDRQLTWDPTQIQGTTTPNIDRLFANFLPVQRVTLSPTAPASIANGGSYVPTATGASSYTWSVSYPVYSPPIVAATSPLTGTSTTATLTSGGGTSRYFDLNVNGAFTYNSQSCTTVTVTRFAATTKMDWEEVTGIEDAVESMNTLNVFPNPFANHVQLDYSFAAPGEGLMQVVDLQGRVVAERVLSNQSSSETVTTSEWAAGTYIVNLTQAGKTIFSKQIVK